MPEHVLVPVDGSPQSEEALEHAFENFEDSQITALTAVDPIAAGYATAPGPDAAGSPGEWTEQAEERADTILEEAADLAAELGRDVDTVRVTDRPARGIVDYTEEHDVDHVVIGSHGRTGVTRVLLGSVSETVVRRTSCPVTVVR